MTAVVSSAGVAFASRDLPARGEVFDWSFSWPVDCFMVLARRSLRFGFELIGSGSFEEGAGILAGWHKDKLLFLGCSTGEAENIELC